MEVSGRMTDGQLHDKDGQIFCQPCSSDGNWVVAKGYCQNCNEFFCDACLKPHRKQSATRNHVILEGKRMPNSPTPEIAIDSCSGLCSKHINETVKFYCTSHATIGCVDCMVLEHKACKVERIQDISSSYFNSPEHRQLVREVGKFLENLEEISNGVKLVVQEMNKTYSQAVADIKAFRKDVNDYLDRVETEILAEVNLRKEKDELTVSELKADQLCMQNEIKSLEEKLKLQSNKANELFVAAKIMTNRKVSIDQSIKQMKEKCQIQQYRFEESPELNVAVSSNVPLGKLKGITRPSQKKITDMEPQFNGEINIKASEDKLDCFIIASVLISPNQIVLADNENSCVKLVDIDQENMLGRYELCTRPVDMAVVNEDRIAVTLPNKQKIQVLSITKNGTFVESHDIKVNDDVRKIAYQRNNLIIAYSNAVEIRNSKGKRVKKINSPDFTCITKIAVAPDCKTFYVSNSVHGGKPTAIYKFDFDCNRLATYKDTTIPDVRGLTVTTDGTLLVCNWADNGSIHMISPQCKKIKEFLQHNEHANSPYCVSFCGQTSKLLLCSYKAFSRDAEKWNVLKMFRMM